MFLCLCWTANRLRIPFRDMVWRVSYYYREGGVYGAAIT